MGEYMGSYFTTQEIKMKLFIAALATVNASVVCPTGWTAGTDATTADDCSPDDVTVTCNSDSMSVKFPIDAVYYEGSVELSSDQLDAAMADVVGSSDSDCIDFAYDKTAAYFTITHSLTGCDTTAVHEAGNLIFSNTYTGDETALTVDGIVTTKVLSFTAECSYADSAIVAVDGVSVSMGTNIAEEVTGTDEYTFTMTTVDKDDATIDSSNAAEIGEAITLKVSPNASLPSNVEFQLIDCTAVSQFVPGRSATEVGLSFNSFTFEAADDSLGLVCNVKLCLTSDGACNNEAQMMTADNLTNFSCNTKYTRSDWWNGIQ